MFRFQFHETKSSMSFPLNPQCQGVFELQSAPPWAVSPAGKSAKNNKKTAMRPHNHNISTIIRINPVRRGGHSSIASTLSVNLADIAVLSGRLLTGTDF